MASLVTHMAAGSSVRAAKKAMRAARSSRRIVIGTDDVVEARHAPCALLVMQHCYDRPQRAGDSPAMGRHRALNTPSLALIP